MDIKETAILGTSEGNHWYYKSKLSALRSALKQISLPEGATIYDVGAGSGFFSISLLKTNPRFNRAVLIDTAYPEESERSDEIVGKTVSRLRNLKNASGGSKPALYLLMDVLEHVKDDRTLLSGYTSVAPAGSYFIITVPAFNFLWSSHDVFLGHYRRYTLSQITSLCINSKLVLINHFYYFALVFPLASLLRLSEKLKLKDNTPPSNPRVT